MAKHPGTFMYYISEALTGFVLLHWSPSPPFHRLEDFPLRDAAFFGSPAASPNVPGNPIWDGRADWELPTKLQGAFWAAAGGTGRNVAFHRRKSTKVIFHRRKVLMPAEMLHGSNPVPACLKHVSQRKAGLTPLEFWSVQVP